MISASHRRIEIFVSACPTFASYSFGEVPESLKVVRFAADVNRKGRLRVESSLVSGSRKVVCFGVTIVNIKKIALLGGVGVASAAVGILIPSMMSGGSSPDSHATSHASSGHDAKAAGHDAKPAGHDAKAGHDAPKAGHDAPKADAHASGGHDAGHDAGHGGKEAPAPPKVGPVFLSFGQLVVNLNEPKEVRYLSLDIAVQTDAKFEDEVKKAMETQKLRLKTWLTSHLADKSMEDLRGKVGVNRLRREIQDNFNSLMFKDGHERVQDVFFDELHIQ